MHWKGQLRFCEDFSFTANRRKNFFCSRLTSRLKNSTTRPMQLSSLIFFTTGNYIHCRLLHELLHRLLHRPLHRLLHRLSHRLSHWLLHGLLHRVIDYYVLYCIDYYINYYADYHIDYYIDYYMDCYIDYYVLYCIDYLHADINWGQQIILLNVDCLEQTARYWRCQF